MLKRGNILKSKKIYGKTPNGGDYSEIFYFDDEGNSTDSNKATKCIIQECKNDGSVIYEIFGIYNAEKNVMN